MKNMFKFVGFNIFNMKKYLLTLVLFFTTFSSIFAQRDTEHWFAPMMARNSSSPKQALYFSTDSTTPFPVTIYSNNITTGASEVIGTVTISKGNPIRFEVPLNRIITAAQGDLFTVKNIGLYAKGDKPFYATLRFSVTSHGEILTSKGKAGIGKKFYAVMSPQTYNSSTNNFTCGIMATEDNTVVTISGYSSSVQFSNGTTGATNPTMTFTLNKGQSYIIDGRMNITANWTGFIGAKIVADKPVSVTNGNFTGQFALTTPGSSGVDIVMDQSVPVERLGDEFIMVKGMGNISEEMEGAVVVATEDNTQVYVNGGAVPVATLNEGQWYRVNSTAYINQGSGHYNLYIKTTKNAYVYQLLAGIAASDATLGFNYIPPLNCFLPRKIDEIGKIEELPYYTPTSTYLLAGVTIKLNILTEAGATVTVNGVTPTAAQGPFPATGTAGWVSYSLTGLTGNVTVVSNKAVTAGIIGGSGVVGYGGYFAGFSSIPAIAKQSGECVPGIVLEVDDGFDSYQWNWNGNPIPGANAYTYTPTQSGNYTCTVTMGTCPPVTTPIYPVYNCLFKSTTTIDACASVDITPAFSTSTQTVVPSTVVLVTPPANGAVTINPTTGVLTYTPNAGFTGNDQFVYKFCGDVPDFTDCEEITVNINFVPFVATDATIYACNVNGKGTFDLTSANVTDTPNVTSTYYPTLADLNAGTNPILNPGAYTVSAPATAYVHIVTSNGCTADAEITMEYYPSPIVYEDTLVSCFIQGNETMGQFDLTTANITLDTPVTYVYFKNLADAQNNINPIADPTAYIAPTSAAYAHVISDKGCITIAKINLEVTPPKPSSVLVNKYICVDATTTLDAGIGYDSYTWSTGETTQSISNVPIGTYWVDLGHQGCVTRQTVEVFKTPDPVITDIEISNNTATVNATGGTPPYKYSIDNISWQDSNVFSNLPRGQNTFYVKDDFDCQPVSVEVTVPNLINVITPNGDGVNDEIDYSALSYKDNLIFAIYDRYGKKMFTADKNNGYKWDGRFSDRKVYTGTYWYHVSWNEPNATKTPVKYSGWILVKNRE